MKHIGNFNVTSSKLVVSDPCYDRNVWCRGELTGVQNGQWDAFAIISDEDDWGMRVAELFIRHESRPDLEDIDADRCVEFTVGVDSGQAGFFCDSLYPQGDTGDYDEPASFYGKACNATLGDHGDIIDDAGVVCSSGFGDGSYDCYVHIDDETGKIVAAAIVFINDEEPE
jgi:hypothetical protein